MINELFDGNVDGLLPERCILRSTWNNFRGCQMNLLVQPQTVVCYVLQDSNRQREFEYAIERQLRLAIDGHRLSAFDMNNGDPNCSLCCIAYQFQTPREFLFDTTRRFILFSDFSGGC